MLAYQIMGVVRTVETKSDPIPKPPRVRGDVVPAPPEPPTELPEHKPPIKPPNAEDDPFVFEPERSEGSSAEEETELYLLNIVVSGGRYRVQIETESSSKWYSEGDAFENYEILSVDPEEGTCEIFDESRNRSRTLYLEE